MNDETPWTPAQVRELWAMWEAGMTVSEIGRRMRRTKNSVIGKAHRLGLPARELLIKPAVPTLFQPPASRGPLPAGHPVTWGLLTNGTTLEGVPYPDVTS